MASFDISKEGIQQQRLGYLDARNSAVAWSKDAVQYLEAARILANSTRNAENEAAATTAIFRLTSPFYFLLCQSIELAFKAYLIDKGASDEKLRRIGHSLVKAMRACEANGYSFDEGFAALVRHLDGFHTAHIFRYHQSAHLHIALPMPTLELVEGGVQRIVASTHASVRQRLSDTGRRAVMPDDQS